MRVCVCMYKCVCVWYLYDTVGPSLVHSVSCPDVVAVLCQSLHQSVLIGRQLHMVQVQGGGLITISLHVPEHTTEDCVMCVTVGRKRVRVRVRVRVCVCVFKCVTPWL